MGISVNGFGFMQNTRVSGVFILKHTMRTRLNEGKLVGGVALGFM